MPQGGHRGDFFRRRCDNERGLRVFFAALVLLLLAAVPASARQDAVALPEVSIFYYPWYGTPQKDGAWVHWTKPETTSFASNYFPARGLYSSSDERVVQAQMREIRAAGIEEIVSSWWGWGSPEDLRLPMIIRAAHRAGLAVAVHLEPYPGRNVVSVQSDIEHLQALGIKRFFVYQPFDDIADADWAALRDSIQDIQLFAQTALVGHAANAHFDGIYTYDVLQSGGKFVKLCAAAHLRHLICLPSVGPGYDAQRATGDKRVKPRRDGKTYDAMWRAAIKAVPDGITITSYNEWHEGTQIEPARNTPPSSAAKLTIESYDGAFGLHGKPAQRAYLARTLFWVAAFARSQQPEIPKS
jgi:glycoprotein endo-alpha-1,2-mannosidase